jgi:predicted DNA binding CopG/RHH family protein
MEEPMNTSRLPQTDSIQELAHFWDTHDITEFEGELEEVGERVFKRDTDITIHLPADDASAVRAMARSRGVGESELLREWVLDRLHAT